MQYLALATDYDGTLAQDGHISPEGLAALARLRASGRKAILVTGRQLPELETVCPQLTEFAAVVAENGALVYWPEERREEVLGEPPSPEFIAELTRLEVQPFAVGRVIVNAWRPFEDVILGLIQQQATGHQIIFNERAVMVLPGGVDKATGLAHVLRQLDINFAQVVGVGNAENDFGFLECCGISATVANALPALQARCDVVTRGDHGVGVIELIDRLVIDDLCDVKSVRRR